MRFHTKINTTASQQIHCVGLTANIFSTLKFVTLFVVECILCLCSSTETKEEEETKRHSLLHFNDANQM